MDSKSIVVGDDCPGQRFGITSFGPQWYRTLTNHFSYHWFVILFRSEIWSTRFIFFARHLKKCWFVLRKNAIVFANLFFFAMFQTSDTSINWSFDPWLATYIKHALLLFIKLYTYLETQVDKRQLDNNSISWSKTTLLQLVIAGIGLLFAKKSRLQCSFFVVKIALLIQLTIEYRRPFIKDPFCHHLKAPFCSIYLRHLSSCHYNFIRCQDATSSLTKKNIRFDFDDELKIGDVRYKHLT